MRRRALKSITSCTLFKFLMTWVDENKFDSLHLNRQIWLNSSQPFEPKYETVFHSYMHEIASRCFDAENIRRRTAILIQFACFSPRWRRHLTRERDLLKDVNKSGVCISRWEKIWHEKATVCGCSAAGEIVRWFANVMVSVERKTLAMMEILNWVNDS